MDCLYVVFIDNFKKLMSGHFILALSHVNAVFLIFVPKNLIAENRPVNLTVGRMSSCKAQNKHTFEFQYFNISFVTVTVCKPHKMIILLNHLVNINFSTIIRVNNVNQMRLPPRMNECQITD